MEEKTLDTLREEAEKNLLVLVGDAYDQTSGLKAATALKDFQQSESQRKSWIPE